MEILLGGAQVVEAAAVHGKHTQVGPTYTLLQSASFSHPCHCVHLALVQFLHIVLVLPGAQAGEKVPVDAELCPESRSHPGVQLDQLPGCWRVEPEGRVMDKQEWAKLFCDI